MKQIVDCLKTTINILIKWIYTKSMGHEVAEGHGFDTRWDDFLNLPNPSSRTRPWGSLNL
jgi:hypothetical protein